MTWSRASRIIPRSARSRSRVTLPGRVLLVALLCGVAAARSSAAAPPVLDAASLADARAGLDHLYHARTSEARVAFERVRARHPESPAADFFLGGIAWHDLTTGAQGFSGGGVAEQEFFARMDSSIAQGERAVTRDPADVSARFFLGGAYGYEARYYALQEKWWDAYKAGRKGVKQLERVVKDAPDLDDAYLGLGIYHYYADVIPSVLKVLGGILGLGGDRERGLAEIRRALRGGALVNVEARFFLGEIYTEFEEDQWTALGFARSLRDEFPENELFTWQTGRILDELFLTDLAAAEWRGLRAKPHAGRVRGFLDYRLARSRLWGGDFQGAAGDLEAALDRGKLGSPAMTMWGRLRYGLALDFLGDHAKAIQQYRLAKDLDASDIAKERAYARLEAGRTDPAVTSLPELDEMTKILEGSRRQGEADLRRVEAQVTGPSRGLAKSGAALYFRILERLANARLVRDDAADGDSAVSRALALPLRPSKESRAELLALRARARFRLGRFADADEDLGTARSLVAGDLRKRYDRERDLLARLAREGPGPGTVGVGPEVVRFESPDHGEIVLEVEGDFLPKGERLRLVRKGQTWAGELRLSAKKPVVYRFVADEASFRPDPTAPRVTLQGDEAWCSRP
ncbi:MAG: tetratricopeptide repeat protein [bacterium]